TDEPLQGAHTMERDQAVFSFDPTGRRLHEDNAHLLSAGPAVRVSLPGGVTAWSVTRLHLLRQLAADDRLSRDARQHWPGLSEVPEDWPLAPFLLSPTVLNAYGSDHRRLRDVMEDAFTEEHMARMRAGLERRVPARLATLGDRGRARSSTSAARTPNRSRPRPCATCSGYRPRTGPPAGRPWRISSSPPPTRTPRPPSSGPPWVSCPGSSPRSATIRATPWRPHS